MKSCKVNRVKQDTLEQVKGDPVISSETNPQNFNQIQEDFRFINENVNKFKSHENKEFEFVSLYKQAGLYSRVSNEIKRDGIKEASKMKIENKKVGQPTLVKNLKEAIKNKKIKCKKVGKPTLVSNRDCLIASVMTLMSGSAIMTALPQGQASPAQAALVTQSSSKLAHHTYDKHRGWVRQASRPKPMVLVQARVDLAAYAALQLSAPTHQVRVSEGHHLADTGASICLGGRQFMRSLGLNESDLTHCDISVCGADNTNITVLGAVLVEFKCRQSPLLSKQVVYVCEGVAGALLSLEACMDLGLVGQEFPKPAAVKSCEVVEEQQKTCGCNCPAREDSPPVLR